MSTGSNAHIRALPHEVYWLLDTEGRVLYVGCSSQLEKRLHQHRMKKEWWPRVSLVEVESFTGRDEALAVESAAIVRDAPLFNKRIPQPRPALPPIIHRDVPLHAVETSAS